MTLPALLAHSCALYGDRLACTTVGDEAAAVTYADLWRWQGRVAAWLRSEGVRRGDRVALWSSNSVRWVAAFWAVTGMGAVLVPLLPDFSIRQVADIIQHCGARLLLIDERLFRRRYDESVCACSIRVVEMTTALLVPTSRTAGSSRDSQQPSFGSAEGWSDDETPCARPAEGIGDEDTAVILYTSGTTGHPKGVMLTHRALTHLLPAVASLHRVTTADVFLSVLPLAHVYEMVVGMILPVSAGAQVAYLSAPPTPQVLFRALRAVRPTAMLIVPLIIEKIYHTVIRPRLERCRVVRWAIHVPPLRRLVYRQAARGLRRALGGRMTLMAIGGAPLDRLTERFLAEGRVPYTCGYGLTETSSLIFGAPPGRTRLRSVGPPVAGVEWRIVGGSRRSATGEILVRWGGNMQGYYREPALTAAVLSPDGWLHTGDLGEIRHGYLYLHGRSKTIILGPNGENIYPEEIEMAINEMPDVIESLVSEEDGRIVGKVYFDPATAARRTEAYLRIMRTRLNARLSRFAQVSKIIEVKSPFARTATRKIKRE